MKIWPPSRSIVTSRKMVIVVEIFFVKLMLGLAVSLFNLQHTLANNLPTLVSFYFGILLLMMNHIATNRVANRDIKFANTSTMVQKLFFYSANVVYLVHCQRCPETQYTGKTGGNFWYRFNNHIHSIRQKTSLPQPLYFNADGHDISDLNVCILKVNLKDTKHRKLAELQFIINLETNKFGFNKDVSFLSGYDTFKHKG